ncbi:hypothetical protein QQP08_017351 [Theobroma cacao]|nr:hypothetical protein QQP08_017351 [Theobroma cacao]
MLTIGNSGGTFCLRAVSGKLHARVLFVFPRAALGRLMPVVYVSNRVATKFSFFLGGYTYFEGGQL